MSAAVSAACAIAGLLLAGFGLDLAHRRRGAAAATAALLAPVGFLIALAGAISLFVPGFFS
ncbi:MAG: hypothetical protein M5R36_12545 [Deltaproteobacteria bacterium]|nr:hypothetical protein [Deltaproteobacteria bacterium]